MRTLIFVAFTVACTSAIAADIIGRVASVRGELSAGPGVVAPGYPLQQGMRLGSSKGAEATLKMADGSLVLVQESTNLMLESFSPGAAVYALDGGVVRLVPGKPTSGDSGAVSLKTPFGQVQSSTGDLTVGICASGCADSAGTYVCAGAGEVTVSSASQTMLVQSGQCAQLTGQQVAVIGEPPGFMVAAAGLTLTIDAEVGGPGVARLRQDAQDFLSGIIDTPASPSQPSAADSR